VPIQQSQSAFFCIYVVVITVLSLAYFLFFPNLLLGEVAWTSIVVCVSVHVSRDRRSLLQPIGDTMIGHEVQVKSALQSN